MQRIRFVVTFTAAFIILCQMQVGAASFLVPIIPPISLLERSPVREPKLLCSDAHFSKCQHSFNKMLNISSFADWNHYEIFVNATDEILQRGVDDGLLLLCNARSIFYQCLGAYYSSCINRFYFLRHGYTQIEAAGFVEAFKELEFMCAGGISQSINHWDCIQTYKNVSDSTYKNCLEQYHKGVELNPNDVCRLAFSMSLCARMPYIVHCGNEVGWWECERFRIALDVDSYCPSLNCPMYLGQSQSNILTRKERFQQRNPYFMRQGMF